MGFSLCCGTGLGFYDICLRIPMLLRMYGWHMANDIELV